MWTFRNFLGTKNTYSSAFLAEENLCQISVISWGFPNVSPAPTVHSYPPIMGKGGEGGKGMISHKKVIFKKFPSLHQKTGLSQTKNAGKNNSFAFWKLIQMLSLSWKVWGLYLDDVLGVSLWITHSTILKLGQPNPTTAEPWSAKMSWFFFIIKGWFIIQNTTS